MLQNVQHIEGLDVQEDFELFDDTPPGAVQARFFVKGIEQKHHYETTGERITKNVIYIRTIHNLGMTDQERPIYDDVVFDEATKKWKVRKLAAAQSHIRRFPNEWNQFMRGTHEEVIGTPLSILFRGDPSKVDRYKVNSITTIEQLAAQNETTIQLLGMGARDDIARAQLYLQKTAERAPGIEMSAKLAEKDRQIEGLQAQLTDLSSKLTQLLTAQLSEQADESPKKRGKTAHQENA